MLSTIFLTSNSRKVVIMVLGKFIPIARKCKADTVFPLAKCHSHMFTFMGDWSGRSETNSPLCINISD